MQLGGSFACSCVIMRCYPWSSVGQVYWHPVTDGGTGFLGRGEYDKGVLRSLLSPSIVASGGAVSRRYCRLWLLYHHVFREANCCADAIASMDHQGSFQWTILDISLACLGLALAADMRGFTSVRVIR